MKKLGLSAAVLIVFFMFPGTASSEGLYDYWLEKKQEDKRSALQKLRGQHLSEEQRKDVHETLERIEKDIRLYEQANALGPQDFSYLETEISGRPVSGDTADLYDMLMRSYLIQDMANCGRHMDTIQKLKSYTYSSNLKYCHEYMGNDYGVFRETYDEIQRRKKEEELSETSFNFSVRMNCRAFRRSSQYVGYSGKKRAKVEAELKGVCPPDS